MSDCLYHARQGNDNIVERNEEKGNKKKGQFKNVKEDRKPFKGVAKELDKRRKKA
jgi:hypothetical protein